MVGIEGHHVGWQESNPDKQGGANRDKDVPGLIEVVRQLASKEAKNSTEDEYEEIKGEREKKIHQGHVTL